ncbi:hypothetical protein ACTFIW_006948 [Dictyostelium discoideum]
MVLILPARRKFLSSLKEDCKINSIKCEDDLLEQITVDLFSGNQKSEAVLYFEWNNLGLMNRINEQYQTVHSMKLAIENFFLSHGGIGKNHSNSSILFYNWNQLVHSLTLFYENREFKWIKRQDSINDIGIGYIFSKTIDDSEPLITRLPYLFNSMVLDSKDTKHSEKENMENLQSSESDRIRAKQ